MPSRSPHTSCLIYNDSFIDNKLWPSQCLCIEKGFHGQQVQWERFFMNLSKQHAGSDGTVFNKHVLEIQKTSKL